MATVEARPSARCRFRDAARSGRDTRNDAHTTTGPPKKMASPSGPCTRAIITATYAIDTASAVGKTTAITPSETRCASVVATDSNSPAERRELPIATMRSVTAIRTA